MTTRYLSCADTAKLLRQALKESFPGVKFSVRSSVYSGGASIDVKWIDGPTSAQVKAVTDQFEGAYFDGMIDYKGSQYHELDGEPVHFGANFIFENRQYSVALLEDGIRAVAKAYGGCEPITVGQYRLGHAWNWTNSGGCNLGDALHKWLNGKTDSLMLAPDAGLEPQPSATLARIKFAGDDGYGQGTVGRESNGWKGEQCYAAIAAAQEVRS